MANRPNKEGLALLQALHLYHDVEIVDIHDGGGFTIGKDTLTIKVNRLSWGYFEQSLLNAVKNRQDLKEWSPELFGFQTHAECEGRGNFPYAPGSPEFEEAYKEHVEDHKEWGDKLIPKEDFGVARFCSPCQGTGLVLKEQRRKDAEVSGAPDPGVQPSFEFMGSEPAPGQAAATEA